MSGRDQEEPLEAGEDGVFDLGDPSVLPAPQDFRVPLSAHSSTCVFPEGGPLQNETTARRREAAPCSPKSVQVGKDIHDSGAADGVREEKFEEAAESLRQQPRERNVEEQKPPGERSIPSNTTEASRAGAPLVSDCTNGPRMDMCREKPPRQSRESYIATGLSNVRLPMPFRRWEAEGVIKQLDEDSDGEAEFHDAFDSVVGMVKDAAKAKEMKELGNGHFKRGDYEEAMDYYSMALEYCPEEGHEQEKAVYFGNRAACHQQLSNFDAVHEDCTAALKLNPRYVKVLMRRAQANEEMNKYDTALEDVKVVLETDSAHKVAKESLARLEKLQTEKMEAMKEEAIGKLKELGNSVLGHFGLSVDNFKMKQDPATGSYSINFER